MNQVKIGLFIAKCRKSKNLTQSQLAEKLNLTDRAVSKWERGKSMPDYSIMLDLCNILDITVDELLNGEHLIDDHHEETVINLVQEKVAADKMLLKMEIVLGVVSVATLLLGCLLAAYLEMEDWLRIVIIIVSFFISFIGIIPAIRIEQVAGYYECGNCGHKYVPNFKSILFSMHAGRTRYLKCPKCNLKSWHKKKVSKE